MTIAKIREGWNRFFHEPIPATTMGLFRILYGSMLLLYAALVWSDFLVWYGARGVLPFGRAMQMYGGSGLSVFHWLPRTDAVTVTVFGIFIIAAVCVTIGFQARIASIVAFVGLVSLHQRNMMILHSGDAFLRLVTFWMMFADAGRSFSVDRLIRLARGKESDEGAKVSPWPLRIVQLQMMFLYADAFLWKISGEQWMSGLAIYYTSRLPEFYRFSTPYVFEHLWTIKLMTWGTLVVEGALGFLLWVKELRYWILLSGVFLHLGIIWTMNIPLFGWVLMIAYVTWIDPRDLERFFAWARERVNRWTHFTEPLPVFYDGRCGFCERSVAVIRRFDALRRIRFIDMHSREAREEFPNLDSDRAASEMLLRGRDGNWFGGFDAYRVMAKHMPALWVTLPFLFVPPVPMIGRKVYAWVAGRRYCIVNPIAQPQIVMGK